MEDGDKAMAMSLRKPLTYCELHANLGTELEPALKQNRIASF